MYERILYIRQFAVPVVYLRGREGWRGCVLDIFRRYHFRISMGLPAILAEI